MKKTFYALGLVLMAIFVAILCITDHAFTKGFCYLGMACVSFAYITYSTHARSNPTPELIPLLERRSDRETRLEMINVAYECTILTCSALNLHSLTHVIDASENKHARLEKFEAFCSRAKAHHAHLVGIVAAFFPEHIELAKSMAGDISNIQGYFNNYIHAGACNDLLCSR
jgi:hypothetical protein